MLPSLRNVVPLYGRGYLVTDFREYPTGSQPADWTKRGANTANLTVSCTSDASVLGGRYMSLSKATTDDYTFLTWDKTPSHTDINAIATLYSNFTIPAGTIAQSLSWRSDASTSPTMMYASLAVDASSVKNTFRLGKVVAGTNTVLASTAVISWNAATYYFIRAESIGTAHQVKFWAVGSAEPSSWGLTAFDSAVTSGTYLGPFAFFGLTVNSVFRLSYAAAALGSTVSAPMPQG